MTSSSVLADISTRDSVPTNGSQAHELPCRQCAEDLAFLRRDEPPRPDLAWPTLTAVDLFCGFGGMSVGLTDAAVACRRRLDVVLAVDADASAAATFERNFAGARVKTESVEQLIDGELGEPLTERELHLRNETGPVSILVGGPPCQGHSDLNNHTRRDDPRNQLYARMARAAEVLEPSAVIIENVPSVANDKGGIVGLTCDALRGAGYAVHEELLDLQDLGVPQRRRRHVVLALRPPAPTPDLLLGTMKTPCADHPRSVKWAIGDLEDLRPESNFDRASTPSEENRRRIALLFEREAYDLDNADRPACHRDKAHTYNSMYGRLRWDRPAQTITTGFGSMGQGRYVHPSRQRTITPREAARLQTIPDYVDLGSEHRRGKWAQMIGNAVPPLLTRALGQVLLPKLEPTETDVTSDR